MAELLDDMIHVYVEYTGGSAKGYTFVPERAITHREDFLVSGALEYFVLAHILNQEAMIIHTTNESARRPSAIMVNQIARLEIVDPTWIKREDVLFDV